MSDHAKDIDALLRWCDYSKSHSWHAALTALVAERNSLKQRVAELEAESTVSAQRVSDLIAEKWGLQQRVTELESRPPASDLRERLVESALQGAARDAHMHHEASSMGTRAVYIVDAAIAAMRKGEV